MSKRVGVTVGFITNSSSVVHHFPRVLLEDPEVAALLARYEVASGFVGDDLFCRDQCSSFLVTDAQKAEVREMFAAEEFSTPTINDSDEVVVIYGDEYEGLAREICEALDRARERTGLADGLRADYN